MGTATEVTLPDIGDFDQVDVIEILVAPGDHVDTQDSLVTLESDKATMEIPSPFAGTVTTLKIAIGDKVKQGQVLLEMEIDVGPDALSSTETNTGLSPTSKSEEKQTPVVPSPQLLPGEAPSAPPPAPPLLEKAGNQPHASPSVRRFARELGANLNLISGSGPKNRIVKKDVQAFIQQALQQSQPTSGSLAITPPPEIDFSRFGPTKTKALSRIQKISGAHLHRCWVSVPHVTQFDEADITELEAFRKSLATKAAQREVKLTPLVFLLKAVIAALKTFPHANASLDVSGEHLILKQYYHIGIAVDTPNGLMVPVIRDVDQKGLFDLAAELGEISSRARAKKLTPNDLQGGCFSISSLGGIGGTGFTPIINAPEVAILGVARSRMQPIYQKDGQLLPRLILPFSLSYDHRVIDGADGVRFTRFLSEVLSDIRTLLL